MEAGRYVTQSPWRGEEGIMGNLLPEGQTVNLHEHNKKAERHKYVFVCMIRTERS